MGENDTDLVASLAKDMYDDDSDAKQIWIGAQGLHISELDWVSWREGGLIEGKHILMQASISRHGNWNPYFEINDKEKNFVCSKFPVFVDYIKTDKNLIEIIHSDQVDSIKMVEEHINGQNQPPRLDLDTLIRPSKTLIAII